MMLAMIAAYLRGAAKVVPGSVLFFLSCLIALSATEWDTGDAAGRPGDRWLFGLALLVLAVAAYDRVDGWLLLHALVPFFAFPYLGGMQNYRRCTYRPSWTTSRDGLVKIHSQEAVFQFGDAAGGWSPGVFRVRAKRALYVDWKAGGQVNFLPSFRGTLGEAMGG